MKYDFRTLSAYQYIRATGVVLLGALLAFQVSAQGTNSAGWSYYPMPDGRTVVYSSGAPVGSIPAVPSPPAGSLVVSGGKAISTDGGAAIKVAGKVPMTLTKGAPVVIDVAAKVPKAAAAALLVKGLKILPVLSTGFALYDLAKELGFNPLKDQSGALTVTKPLDGVSCTATTCLEYWDNNGAWHKSGLDAISAWFATPNNGCTSRELATCYTPISCNGAVCTYSAQNYSSGNVSGAPRTETATMSVRTVPLFTDGVSQPATVQDLQDAIAAKSGWPTSSNVSAALRDAAQLTGEPVPIEGPNTVTGPATSPGRSTTVQNSDGTKSVTTTVNNHSYAGNTINTSTVTTTNNYNTSNQITSSTTVTAEPAPEKPSDCDKYPDSNACRKDEFDTPAGEVPKTTKNITLQVDNLGFGGGSCPADKVLTFHGVATPIKVVNWADNCDKVTTYAKPMILALATFAALMILFAGGRPE